MKSISIMILIASIGLLSCMENMTPNEIFKKVTAAYKSKSTYKTQGTITSNTVTGAVSTSTKTSFSIIMKKPNLYLIFWSQESKTGATRSGAVWNDGTQPYLYEAGVNAYTKMRSDELALASATGISEGTAYIIPSLFLAVFKEEPQPFSRLKDPQIEMTEKVGEEDCYVISGSTPASKKETYWISKKSYLIKKHYLSYEPPEKDFQIPEFSDEHFEKFIKTKGLKVTEERKQKLRSLIDRIKQDMTQTKGSSVQLYDEISSPVLNTKDFQFALPVDAILKSIVSDWLTDSNPTGAAPM